MQSIHMEILSFISGNTLHFIYCHSNVLDDKLLSRNKSILYWKCNVLRQVTDVSLGNSDEITRYTNFNRLEVEGLPLQKSENQKSSSYVKAFQFYCQNRVNLPHYIVYSTRPVHKVTYMCNFGECGSLKVTKLIIDY